MKMTVACLMILLLNVGCTKSSIRFGRPNDKLDPAYRRWLLSVDKELSDGKSFIHGSQEDTLYLSQYVEEEPGYFIDKLICEPYVVLILRKSSLYPKYKSRFVDKGDIEEQRTIWRAILVSYLPDSGRKNAMGCVEGGKTNILLK